MRRTCQVDTRLLVQTQILHLKRKYMILTKKTEIETESTQNQLFLEPNTNPTENTKQNPLKMQDCSNSDIFTEQTPNKILELQKMFSEVFSL